MMAKRIIWGEEKGKGKAKDKDDGSSTKKHLSAFTFNSTDFVLLLCAVLITVIVMEIDNLYREWILTLMALDREKKSELLEIT